MELPDAALRRASSEYTAWLTTVTVMGGPSPVPVWFVLDGPSFVVFTEPTSKKVTNIERQPRVSLHFDARGEGPEGEDIVVVRGMASIELGHRPTDQPGFLDKYAAGIMAIGMTNESFDATYSSRLRLTPTGVWLGPE